MKVTDKENQEVIHIIDPQGDPMLFGQIREMIDRGEAYHLECERHGVKFLPRQVMHPVYAKVGLGNGPLIKHRKSDFLVLDFQS